MGSSPPPVCFLLEVLVECSQQTHIPKYLGGCFREGIQGQPRRRRDRRSRD